LRMTLLEHSVSGAALGFEMPATVLNLRNPKATEFVQQVKKRDCHISISGFGQDQVLFDLTRGLGIEFLKVDCSITLNILDNPADLAAVQSIANTAKEIGVKTVVELVEKEETIGKLREIGIDFAQGYGISTPCPLVD
jgi:EAL domain-containing protein (putative c-di-GMP-specific phosphodiesterase class I)